jgi:DNA-binding CsgD family transcriptional regulator
VIHLVVLVNLAILAVGIGVAGGLFRYFRRNPGAAGFWQLLHFLALTFTMAVAALDAYYLVNLGFGPFASRLFSSLVLLGTAAMLFFFPLWNRARVNRERGPRFVAFWGLAALIPVAAAAAMLVLQDLKVITVLIAVAFIPFFGSVFYSLSLFRGDANTHPRESWIALAVLGLIATAEILWIFLHPMKEGYFFITLPLAYLYVCRGAWRDRARPTPESARMEIPSTLAQEKSLTERELRMAQGILEGKSNKELAYELGIAENTVRNHIYNLYRKLGIQKRLDLVLLVQKYQTP